jgi:hypothetical protein
VTDAGFYFGRTKETLCTQLPSLHFHVHLLVISAFVCKVTHAMPVYEIMQMISFYQVFVEINGYTSLAVAYLQHFFSLSFFRPSVLKREGAHFR